MKNKFLFFACLSVFVLSLIFNHILFTDNQNLVLQIEKRDKIIDNVRDTDTLINSQRDYNDRITKKYISDCNILINGKKISTEELLDYINELVSENANLIDSLYLIKNERQILLNKFSAQIISEKEDGKITSKLTSNVTDSLKNIKALLKLIEKNYGITGKIEKKENNNIISLSGGSKIDSALIIYKYYKNKLSVDSSGNILIELPRNLTSPSNRKKN